MYLLEQYKIASLDEAHAKYLIKNLNVNEANRLVNEMAGKIFWFNKKAVFNKATAEHIALFKSLISYIKSCINYDVLKHEYNQNGVRIQRESTSLNCDAYGRALLIDKHWSNFLLLDFCHRYWVNHVTLEIVCYCEGDLITRTAIDIEMLQQEMNDIYQWHKEND
ncbi:hypothetical protein [Thalassotalea piscium]|uniref:Uncharacterized protein n=1 Tax=Thalassotalea piscium TaxID=1230533 RepID=A0A7X0TTD9_9GAMM|nr:hypothetical protein [Thalassotalea piscium]MBB6543121.1 hypothetical protein [Thalassotalea piscium]